MIFETLHSIYSNTLQCPCSHIANSYQSFTSLSPMFHPICSSKYITDQWLTSISGLNTIDSVFDIIDFRTAAPTFFNSLATFCSLSSLTVDDAWYIFKQTPLITDSTLTQTEFQARTKATMEQFQKSTISEFQRILSVTELHTQTMYATGYGNIYLSTDQLSTNRTPFDLGWKVYEKGNCSCALNNQCDDVMSFFIYTDNTIYSPYYLNFIIPDLLIGCLVISSTLRSSLECFFNQTCLNAIQAQIQYQRSLNITVLNKNSTRFAPEGLIGTILDSLMIETWNEQVDYDKYFDQCAPEQCTYSYTSSENFLQIFTKVVGLFGGLAVAFQITVPFIIGQIRNRIRSRREPRVLAGKIAENR